MNKSQIPLYLYEPRRRLNILEKITSYAQNQDYIVILIGRPSPLISKSDSLLFQQFFDRDSGKIPTSIGITEDSHYIIVGYDDGYISVYLTESKALMGIHRTDSRGKIMEISTICGHDFAFLLDDNNTLIQLHFFEKSGDLNIEERAILHNDRPVQFLAVPSPEVLYACSPDTVFSINTKTQEATKIIEIPPGQRGIRLAEGPELLFASYLTTFWIIPLDQGEPIKGETPSNIFRAFSISNNCFAAILKDASIALINGSGTIFDLIKDIEMKRSLKTSLTIFSQSETIICQHPKYADRIGFVDWRAFVLASAELGKWDDVFSGIQSVLKGVKTNFFGVPKLPQERIDQICSVLQIVQKFVQNRLNYYSVFFDLAAEVGLQNLITDNILNYCVDTCHVSEFLDSFFRTNILKRMSIESILKVFRVAHENGQDEKLQSLIDQCIIPNHHLKEIEHQAITFGLHHIVIKILGDNCYDYLEAAKYAFTNGILDSFIYNIFVAKSCPDPHKRILLLFLMDKMDKVFNYENQVQDRDYPMLFTIMTNLLPVKCLDNTSIEIDDLIDSILRGIANVRNEQVKLLIEVMCPLIGLNEIKIPIESTSVLFWWSFTANSWVTQREAILMKIIDQYPNLFDPMKFLDSIQSAGFSNLMIKLRQPITKVVFTMSICPERRLGIFDYLIMNIQKKQDVAQAIVDNFPLMVVINALSTVSLIGQFIPQLHNLVMRLEKREYIRFVYLSAAKKSMYRTMLTNEEKEEIQGLVSKYSSQ